METPFGKPPRHDRTAKDSASMAVVHARFREGFALHQRGHLAEAQALYQQVLSMQPRHFDALHLLGVIAAQTKDSQRAVELLSLAIDIKPDYAEAYNNRGLALQALERWDAAIASFDEAIKLRPGFADAHNNRGVALTSLRRHQAALECYGRAVTLNPDSTDAWINHGNALKELQQSKAALNSYERAIARNPDHALAYNNRGLVLRELGQLNDSLASFDRAIELVPHYADAYGNRGATLEVLGQLAAALNSYEKAIELKPDFEFLHGTRLATRMRICDWRDAKSLLAQLLQKIGNDEKASAPFPLLALSGSLPLQRRAAEIWVDEKCPAIAALPAISKPVRNEKIRIGYYSADYYNHATSYLMAELFEKHDKSKFELVAFSFGPDTDDAMRKRIAAAFEQFIDVRDKSDQDIALLSRSLGIDIAVDLKGFTQDHRVGIFSCRAAPIQVQYLGYPGTMGAKYIDYLIADRTLVPEASRQYYTEKIAYLPNSYQVNDRQRRIADKTFSRAELGLPGSGFVFCCFNHNYKITPDIFDCWMRILRQVEHSVLWLIDYNDTAVINLRREAEVRGVTAGRLVFARPMPLAEHLARHRAADLFMDTLPYNAHTTASDALWAGLPVLTCLGEAFAGRVAASLLNAIALEELIVTTSAQYETLAVELASNPDRLKQIRQKLDRNRLTTPLFDSQLFTRNIEAAYAQMYDRYQNGLAPEHIHVDH